MTSAPDLAQSLEAIGSLLARLDEGTDPHVRACAQGVVRAVLDFHRAGLARCLEMAHAQGEPGTALVAAWGRDDLVGSLLALHGLHPTSLEARARAALGGTCPNGWRLTDVHAEGEALRVAFARTADPRRAAEPARVRSWVMEALARAVPDADAIDLVGDLAIHDSAEWVPVERLVARRAVGGGAP